MAILIVGADKLGNIDKEINIENDQEIIHWAGRSRVANKKYVLPCDVNMVIVFYDFINHNLMYLIKKQAKRNKVRVIYSKRNIIDLRRKLI